MDNKLGRQLSYLEAIKLIGAISCGFLVVALAVKSLFSQDVSLSVLDAQLEISNSKLELSSKATEIQRLSNQTEEIIVKLQEATRTNSVTTENLKACHSQLEEYLPDYKDFPRQLPEVKNPIKPKELEQVKKELNKTQQGLSAEIDSLFNE